MWRHVFKNRWVAIAWAALICWQAADFARSHGPGGAAAASPGDAAALQAAFRQPSS